MNEEKAGLPAEAVQEKQQKTILSSAKQFFGTALSPLKSRDPNQLIEEFTGEMTIVAEGLSEDQARISRLIDNVASQQTLFENDTENRLRELKDAVRQNGDRIASLESDLEKLQTTVNARNQKTKKADGWTGFIRQATWLVAIAAGAAVIIALINKLL